MKLNYKTREKIMPQVYFIGHSDYRGRELLGEADFCLRRLWRSLIPFPDMPKSGRS